MTRDEILAMKPGRELDTLVMRTVFKAEKKDIGDECYWVSEVNGEEVCWPRWFSPSTDIAAAWEVVGELQNDYVLDFKLERKYCVAEMKFVAVFEDLDGKKWVAHGWIASEAICKAALLAVMDGEDEHERD